MKTNTEKETITEVNETPAFYDGMMEMRDFDMEGKITTTKKKFFLNSDEVKDFFKSHDPADYFREGHIPVFMKKELGTLLAEDRAEVMMLRKVFEHHPKVLLFKHDYQNIYTILIPKSHSEHEMRDGEFAERFIFCDTRSVVFSGFSGAPSAYEPGYFKKKCEQIVARLNAMNARRSAMI
jgi:hypothetical protein